MNKVIKEQLGKVKIELPKWDDTTTHMRINRVNGSIDTDISVGSKVTIHLAEYITKPFDGFDLHTNWNEGIVPKSSCFEAEVIQVVGKMIKIDGYGMDATTHVKNGEHWVGWLPRKSFTIEE